MRLLLDTNILIWALIEPEKLSKQAKHEIEHATSLYVSSASIWEISIKASLGKIKINVQELINLLEEMNIEQLPITWEHSRLVNELPFHHHDPFDRILIAQTISEPLIFLTHNKMLLQYSDLVKFV